MKLLALALLTSCSLWGQDVRYSCPISGYHTVPGNPRLCEPDGCDKKHTCYGDPVRVLMSVDPDGQVTTVDIDNKAIMLATPSYEFEDLQSMSPNAAKPIHVCGSGTVEAYTVLKDRIVLSCDSLGPAFVPWTFADQVIADEAVSQSFPVCPLDSHNSPINPEICEIDGCAPKHMCYDQSVADEQPTPTTATVTGMCVDKPHDPRDTMPECPDPPAQAKPTWTTEPMTHLVPHCAEGYSLWRHVPAARQTLEWPNSLGNPTAHDEPVPNFPDKPDPTLFCKHK